MSKLFDNHPKRFFAFGCSFTSYGWPTWADIVSIELGPATTYYNFGRSGAGNQYIANMIAQADAKYNFDQDDLVMVCWTNVAREDRMFVQDDNNSHWVVPGNLANQDIYDREWLDKFGSCTDYFYLRDFASIHLVTGLLKKTVSHQMSMLDMHSNWDQYIDNDVAVDEKSKGTIAFPKNSQKILPSFYKVLWNNKLKTKLLNDMKHIHRYYQDTHPTPIEHWQYLQKVFKKHKWSKTTERTAKTMQLEFTRIIKTMYDELDIKQPTLPFQVKEMYKDKNNVDSFDSLNYKYSMNNAVHEKGGIFR